MVANLAGDQLATQRRLQFALDKPLEWPRSERRIVAALGQVVSRPVGQLELDLALLQPLAQPDQLHIDNLAQLVARQWMEHDDLVDAVQKLRPKALAQYFERLRLHLLVVLPLEPENYLA